MNTHDPSLDSSAIADAVADEVVPEDRSLTDDVFALFDDGKTYIQSEIQYQKTRVAFAADRGKSGIVYGIGALALLHLALVALVVGLVIALTPVVGPWLATIIVVALLAVGGIVLALSAKKKFAGLAAAYRETKA